MKGKRILLVEDELLIARHIEQMVKNLGYQVAGVVESGEQALRVAAEQAPDLVLMDIRLKGQLDGIEAATRIWKLYSIPIVYLTAFTDEDTLIKATLAEPFGYLIKPFDEKELLVAIELAFYKHQVDTENKEKRRWLNAILSSITDGLISTDREGLINFINPVAESLLGKTSGQAIGQPLENIFLIQEGPAGKPCGFNLDRLASDLVADQDFYLATGEVRLPVELRGSLIRDEAGTVVGSVLVFRDITQRKLQEERLNYLAIHDALTDLPNRLLFNDRLRIGLEQARRRNLKLGVIMLDLDFFKVINDTYGHSFGDLVLIEAGKILKQLTRKTDTVARFGGDEFTILLGELHAGTTGLQIAERIVQAFNLPMTVDNRKLVVTASLGLALFPDHGLEPEDLLKRADLALYAAKDAGRNRVQLYSEKF
ncbi:MAG: diguanylate cyclase [Candidatus Saccharicenans sp.]|jgi:diguanylate cyclase (GGDEF)-like protein/PAS domain S-box-containing protein|nr:diguanylate cyclase [Candidatus Saccharicenans sp.]